MVAPNKSEMNEAGRTQRLQAFSDNTRGLLMALDVSDGSHASAMDVLTEDVTSPIIEIAAKMGKALERFNGAPPAGNVRAAAEQMVVLGALPTISQGPPGFVQGNDVAQAVWKMLADEAKPLNRAGLTRARASTKLEGERLAGNVEFWDNTYRITAAVATLGVTELTDKLTGELKKLSDEVRAVNVGRRRLLAMMADPKTTPEKRAEAQRTLAKVTGHVDAGKLAIATELLQLSGYNATDLGLGGFEGLGGFGGASVLVGRIGGIVNKIPWLPPQIRSLLMGGTAAVLLGLLILVAVLMAAVYAIRTVLEAVGDSVMSVLGFGGQKGGANRFIGALVILGAGYWAYKKGYLAKIGLKPAGSAA